MLSTLVPLLLALVSGVLALNPIAIRDNVFYDTGTNQRFFLIGVDYQPGGAAMVKAGSDPLSDIEVCQRDVFLFQRLGVNTVRIYSVDNAINHDPCMSLYNTAGIYLLLDVNSPIDGQHLNRKEPWTTYNSIYAEHVFKTIEAFGGYANTLGFLSGNEVINDDQTAIASAPYIKAITRDMKAYIRAHLDRPIPVGYSAADNLDYRTETATYMSCGTDSDGLNDFYAINSYQWCGNQTIHSSGYDTLISQFSNFTLPLLFSEFGCNKVLPREFTEVSAIYSSDMTPSFSGGLAYEFSQEIGGYGLANISSSDGSVQLLSDFDALQKQYSSISGLPAAIPSGPAASVSCPSESSYKYLNGSLTIPSLSEIQVLIESGVSQTPGTLSLSVPLTQATDVIVDVAGSTISDKQITSASSSGSVGSDLKTLFGTNTGTAAVARATASVAKNGAQVNGSSGASGAPKSSSAHSVQSYDRNRAMTALLVATTCMLGFLIV